MTRSFHPPPDPKRCCAVTWETYFAARCPARRIRGSDLCQAHRDMLAEGKAVRRVKPARRIAASPEPAPQAEVIDLMEVLKASLAKSKSEEKS